MFPIKKGINTEVFIDVTLSLYKEEPWISNVIKKGDQRNGIVSIMGGCIYLDRKGAGMKDKVTTDLLLSFIGNVIKIELML